MALLKDVARIIRSKNAGANLLTLDVLFADRATFERVQAGGVLGPALIARLYGVAEADVRFTAYPEAYAFKATLPRLHLSGDPADSDMYGAQQHAPLLDVELPDEA